MALPNQVLKVSEGGDSPTSLAGFNHSYPIFFFFLSMLKISLDAGCGHCLLPFGCTPLREIWLPLVLSAAEDHSHIRLHPQPFLLHTSSLGFLSPPCTSCPTALVLLHWTWPNTLMPFTGKPENGHDRALQTWPQWKGAALGCSLLRQPGMF